MPSLIRLCLSIACMAIAASAWAQSERRPGAIERMPWPSERMQPQGGRRVALVIGNGAYRHVPSLQNPGNDARAIADALRRAGFDVVLGVDLDSTGMNRIVQDFRNKLAASRADVAAFYYSGHALQFADSNQFFPIDARFDLPVDMIDQSVPLDRLQQIMQQGARATVFLIDAARENPLSREWSRWMGGTRSGDIPREPGRLAPGTNSMIAYAASPGTVAADGDGPNSPFAAALVRQLQTPGLDAMALLRNVRDEVTAATGGTQVPWFANSLSNELVLYTSGHDGSRAALPLGQDDEAALWEMIRNGRDERALQTYLNRYPAGRIAPLAQVLDGLRSSSGLTQAQIDAIYSIPPFEWPPPRASGRVEIPRAMLLPAGGAATLAQVSRRLQDALARAGYDEHSFYRIRDGGIALVTRIERLTGDGSPEAGARWRPPEASEAFSLMGFVRSLLWPQPGHYRLIVFTMTAETFSNTGTPIAAKEAAQIVARGVASLPKPVANLPYTPEHHTFALIYEFEKDKPEATPVLLDPGRFTAMQHLQKAAIWAALQGAAARPAERTRP